ncbi:DUF4181 domain-containing protein [Saliterribacillus persicus]|uniref:Uncharacterized protein DUF4181 n=1 Tax=Saliterribacillus persicus TaxID=930114 RepID=A0A368Y9H7_9BACI|nr:DUF4181 domain-containing protein [Saliterribacillus persicus]RCW76903.1 uncharacterized protein DUF4181 [Saliterribacillus persicus]
MIVIALLILLIVVEKIANKILSVEKIKMSETSGKIINRWGQTILFIIFLVQLWLMVDSSDMQRMFYFTIYLALLFGYQALMEFIFIKKSKQYISTAILLSIVLIIINLESFPFMVKS